MSKTSSTRRVSKNRPRRSDFETQARKLLHLEGLARHQKRSVVVRLMTGLLMMCMLSVTVPAAPETVTGFVANGWQEARFAILSSGMIESFPTWVMGLITGNSAPAQNKRRKIAGIQVYPRSATIRQGDEAVFSAVAVDRRGDPVSGVQFEWRSQEAGGADTANYLVDTTFKGQRAGTFTVIASTEGFQGEATVTVEDNKPQRGSPVIYDVSSRSGSRIRKADDASTDQQTTDSEKPSIETGVVEMNLPGEGWDDTNWTSADDPGNQTGNPPGSPADGGAGNGNFQLSAPVVSLPGRGIDLALNLSYNSRVWNKAGSNIAYDVDFDEPAPGWNLGFGRIVSMGSQGGCMIIDADGTRRGYTGSVSSTSSWMSFTGHTADGGFIDYGCSFTWGNYGSGWSKLSDGTSVLYSSITPTETHLHPTKITDAQGNYITITYNNVSGNAMINTVTDTLGRVITFHYDSLNRLIEVRGPRMTDQDPVYGTGAIRTLVRLHYKALTLNYSFYGLTPIVRNGTPWVIDSIYYPATNTGYWFDDSDSYSSYGMITKVEEQTGMSWSTSSEAQGTVSPGTVTKTAEYNYPLTVANQSGRTNGVSLTDAPTYTDLKESWDGMDVTGPAVTTYALNNNDWHSDGTSNSPARSVTVTQPTGVINKQYSYRTPGTWTDGLVFYDETVVTNGATQTTIASSLVSWQQGNYDSPRPSWAEITDENGHKVKTVYEYSTNKFNQITKSCDYDNGNNKLRCAVAQYENGQSYIGNFNTSQQFTSGRHIFNLVLASGIENPDGTRASWTEYEYDNYVSNPLANTPGVIQHTASHNPHNTSTYPCNCHWSCEPSLVQSQKKTEDKPDPNKKEIVPLSEQCEDGLPPSYWVCDQCQVYDYTTAKRGNVTKITTYTDAQALTGPVYETRGYDITGNVVKTSSSCCEETSILYDDPATTTTYENYYAYPLIQTRGASDPNSPHRITTSSVYSFETGLVKQSTDANGLASTTWYNPDTLRPVKSVSSTGAYSTFGYDDAAMTVTEEAFEITTGGPQTAGKTTKYLNGIGQVRKEEAFAPNSVVDIVETKYTLFGEEWKQSRPYRSGDTIQWSERFYDAQRRLIKVVEPDGSETKAFYNETAIPDSGTSAPGNKMRVMDAWGRDRWGRYDQQGRLVEVVEPNPDATANPTGSVSVAGSLVTKYSFDTMGRLTQTEQGAQLRKFKYDSLGRLTHQKLAEQTATLNDAGDFVGAGQSGANWSEAFVYDTRSNLERKTDPRGVKTHFSYQLPGGGLDPLNRIQSRTYDTTSGPIQPNLPIENIWGVTVSYEYMTTGDKGRIKKITTSNVLTEDYSYDGESRISEYKQTYSGRESYPMTTSYLYDTLDRVAEVTYPAQWGQSGNPRKIVKKTYDTASRFATLTYGTAVTQTQQAGNIDYNASDQTTSIKIGEAGTNQVTEEYTFDPQTGLLTNQTAIKNGTTTLLDLSYEYSRNNSVGSLNGKTGHLTKIIDNLNINKNREYRFDALGRLTYATNGGTTGALWKQTYSYDRFGNRTNVTKAGNAADGSPIPMDGIPNLTYDNTSNRITTSGYEYDVAGNQIRSLAEDGVTWLKYEYDAANRIRVIKKDDTNQTLVQAFMYGSTNARLVDYNGSTYQNTFICSVGGTVLTEYVENSPYVFTWTKSNTYLGDTQLATITPNGTNAEYVEFSHPDRLGTRLKTNQTLGTSYEQAHLPFGTALNAESTMTDNPRRFTSYERSAPTGLDYAINRTYDSKLGRFTQVDPIGMKAVDMNIPQSLNLYSYCGNDPVNHVDPDGLFWGKLFKAIGKFFKKAFKWIAVAISVAIAVLTIIYAPVLFATTLKAIFGIISAVAGAAESVLSAFNLTKAARVLGIISAFASFGASLLDFRSAAKVVRLRAIFAVVSSAASAVSKTLTAFGHNTLGKIFGLVSTVAGFIKDGLKDITNKKTGEVTGLKWNPSSWKTYKFIRSAAEQVAEIAGKTRLAGYLNVLGIVDDVVDSYLGIRDFLKNNVGGGEKVTELDFLKNERRELSGFEELSARFDIFTVNILKRSNQQAGRVNSIIRRVEKGVSLAR